MKPVITESVIELTERIAELERDDRELKQVLLRYEKLNADLIIKNGRLTKERDRLAEFVKFCRTLTGSLYPQNETTGYLKEVLALLDKE